MATNTIISLLSVWIIVNALTSLVEGLPNGAPYYTCRRMTPSHPSPRRDIQRFPYDITLNPTKAMPGENVTVTVSVKEPGYLLNGLLSTVLDMGGNFMKGFIILPDDKLKLVNCSTPKGIESSTGLTHAERVNTSTKSFLWQVPADATVDTMYNIRITVVHNVSTYWVGLNNSFTVGRLEKPNTQDVTPSNTGSGTRNTGSTSQVPSTTSQRTNSNNAGSTNRNRQQARAGSGLAQAVAQRLNPEAQSTNMVIGGRGTLPRRRTNTLSTQRGRMNSERGRGNGRRGQRPRMAAWLAGWFSG